MPRTKWTVARSPSGEWTTGGRPNDPDYEGCEVYTVEAFNRVEAKRKAQSIRSQERLRSQRLRSKALSRIKLCSECQAALEAELG